MGEDTYDRAGEVAASFRDAGVAAAMPFDRRSLRAHMKAAERSGARFAVLIGERELANATVTLRRLSDGHQDELGADEAIKSVLTQRDSP